MLRDREPFKTVLSGNRDAIEKLSMRDIFEIVLATQSGMTVEEFIVDVNKWLATAKHPPMEASLYRSGISADAGGSQLPAWRFSATCAATASRPTSQPAGPGFRSRVRREFTEYHQSKWLAPRRHSSTATTRISGPSSPGSPNWCSITCTPERSKTSGWSTVVGRMRLSVILATREYAYGPAQGLPDTKVGTLSQAMYDMAKKQDWAVISMKNDWKRIFSFE